MPSFPSPERIIEELNECRSYFVPNDKHPRRGEVEAADYIIEFARKWSLGDVRRVPIPQKSSKFSSFVRQEPELSNVVIDTGTGKDERLFLHGHFDVVQPDEYESPDKARLIQDSSRMHIYRGLGSYDMLTGVASILIALHQIKVAAHRNIRTVLVFGEENDSEGTHAAFDNSNNLFEFNGDRCALSTEITVNSTLNDPYHLVVGRPGRFEFKASIYGDAMHAGSVNPDNMTRQTWYRSARVKEGLTKYKEFRLHPHDTRHLLKPGQICIGNYETKRVMAIGTRGEEDIQLHVHYADPNVTIAEIHRDVARVMQDVLGDDRFELTQPRREMPWTPPWMEELDNPQYRFPHIIQHIAAEKVAPLGRQGTVEFRTGQGVADENILSAHGIPVICVPPRGQYEHNENECVDIRCVYEYQVPTIREAAGYEGSLLRGTSGA